MKDKQQLGDFTLEKKLGAGGMGEVWRARQISLDRVVAVKILPKSLASQENFHERFRREAQAAANLIHPNVIQIYSIGIEGGIPYFAMEYVEGDDLQQRMKRKAVDYTEAVEITAGVASALACAYEKGIVHRDIKPSNIMIDKSGVVKVMDFGLAKTIESTSSNLTASGLIMGTPNYISPEQGKGEPIDTRSDIYSLGVCFYEMLTGVLPFRADTPAALIYKHAFEVPDPPTKLKAGVPPFLEDICLRTLAKDPRDRYPNPKALLTDLNEYRRQPDYYVKGGKRRGPVPTGQSGMYADKTITDGQGSRSGGVVVGSGSQAATVKSGISPVAGAGVTGGVTTGQFREQDTNAEAALAASGGQRAAGATGPQTVGAPIGAGSFAKIFASVVVVAGVGAAAYLLFFRPPPAPLNPLGTDVPPVVNAQRVTVPFSQLEPIIQRNRGVEAWFLDGAKRYPISFADRELDPDKYTLAFKKRGYREISIQLVVTRNGHSPKFEEIETQFASFEPGDELIIPYEKGKKALQEGRYDDAVEEFERVREIDPNFRDTPTIYGQAKGQLEAMNAAYERAKSLQGQRLYKEAKEVVATIPKTFRQYGDVQALVSSCDLQLARIETKVKNYEADLGDGDFGSAESDVRELEALLPPTDPRLDEWSKQTRRARKLYDDLVQYYKNEDWRNANEAVTELAKLCPRHDEMGRMRKVITEKIEAGATTAQKYEKALKDAVEARARGDWSAAHEAAKRALDSQPESQQAKEILAEAEKMLVTTDLTQVLSKLDQFFLERKTFNVMNLVDSGAADLHKKIQTQLDAFYAAPIEVIRSEHEGVVLVSVEPQNGAADRASVECRWVVELRFPEADLGTPPVKSRVTKTIVQKISFRRGSGGWLITACEQVGVAK